MEEVWPAVLDAAYLADLQRRLAAAGQPWTAGPTFFSGFPIRHLIQPLAGARTEVRSLEEAPPVQPGQLGANGGLQTADGPVPPSAWKWTEVAGRNFIDPVCHQGLDPACIAYGVTGAVQAAARIAAGIAVNDPLGFRLPELSPAPLARDTIPDALRRCQSEGLYPAYLEPIYAAGWGGALRPEWAVQRTRLRSIVRFDETQTLAMKKWLSRHGPLVTSFLLPQNLDLLLYRGGVYRPTASALIHEEAHCVVIIGYDDQRQAWRIKNSWGPDWGEAGLAWMAYGACYLDTEVYGFDGIDAFVRPLE